MDLVVERRSAGSYRAARRECGPDQPRLFQTAAGVFHFVGLAEHPVDPQEPDGSRVEPGQPLGVEVSGQRHRAKIRNRDRRIAEHALRHGQEIPVHEPRRRIHGFDRDAAWFRVAIGDAPLQVLEHGREPQDMATRLAEGSGEEAGGFVSPPVVFRPNSSMRSSASRVRRRRFGTGRPLSSLPMGKSANRTKAARASASSGTVRARVNSVRCPAMPTGTATISPSSGPSIRSCSLSG